MGTISICFSFSRRVYLSLSESLWLIATQTSFESNAVKDGIDFSFSFALQFNHLHRVSVTHHCVASLSAWVIPTCATSKFFSLFLFKKLVHWAIARCVSVFCWRSSPIFICIFFFFFTFQSRRNLHRNEWFAFLKVYWSVLECSRLALGLTMRWWNLFYLFCNTSTLKTCKGIQSLFLYFYKWQ